MLQFSIFNGSRTLSLWCALKVPWTPDTVSEHTIVFHAFNHANTQTSVDTPSFGRGVDRPDLEFWLSSICTVECK